MSKPAEAPTESVLRDVALADLVPHPDNPRKRRNAEADEELLNSIKARGILNPLLVRPLKNQFQIGAGHRRWEMAGAAGLESVPVIVREFSDEEFYDLVMIDNLQHADLHPLDQADGYVKLMTLRGLDFPGLAALVNRRESELQQSVKLLDLAAPVRLMFESNRIDVKAARLLCRLAAADQQAVVKGVLGRYNNPKTVNLPTSLIREAIDRQVTELARAPFALDDAALYPAAGSCLACPKRSGANAMLFADVQDKDRCFDRTCFDKKLSLNLKQKAAGLKEENKLFRSISMRYHASDKKLLSLSDYIVLKKGAKDCPNTVIGLVEEGNYHSDGEVGQSFKICLAKGCPVHSERYSGSSRHNSTTPTEKLKTRITNLTAKRDLQVRVEILGAVLDSIRKGGPSTEDMRVVVQSHFHRYWHDAKREFFKRKGIEPIKSKSHGGKDFELTFQTHFLDTIKTVQQAQALLFDLAMQFELQRSDSRKAEEDELYFASVRHNIPTQTITDHIAAEYAPKLEKLKKPAKQAKLKPAATKKTKEAAPAGTQRRRRKAGKPKLTESKPNSKAAKKTAKRKK